MNSDRLVLIEAVKRGYYLYKSGKLFNFNGVEVKGHITDTGYLRTNIRLEGKYKHVKFHRLQAYLKFSDRLFDIGMMVRHLNGNKLDNSYENIEIGSNHDNQMDIPKHSRLIRSKPGALKSIKYCKEDVINYHNIEKSYKKTMEYFKISSKGTLNYILNDRVY